MSVTIRLFEERDRGSVLDLWLESDIDQPWLNLDAEIDEMLRHDGSLFLVAVDGDAIVGAVMGAYDGPRGWVYHLAVTPEQRKAGIGRLLMESLEQRMRERGVAKVNLQVRADNIHVVAFYDGLGYADEPLTSMGKRLQA
jgi:ribosomal protein S18 acetylase RimI-like enzyme